MSEPEKAQETTNEMTPSPPAEVGPYDERALGAAFKLPYRVLEIVLAEPGRLAKTIAANKHVSLLVFLMIYTSILFALPFGAVLEPGRFWRIALLYVGSFAICFPSLQVFSAYIGCRINTGQNLALGLVITAVAAIFTFGFFPILWFLKATMLDESARVTPHHISVVLLSFSLLAGIGHLFRCFYRLNSLVSSSILLIIGWQVLFIYITYRMAVLLDLL